MSEGFKLNIRLDDAAFRATADIAKYDKATQDKIKAAIADGVKTVYEEAVNRAPKRTGAFIKGIKMEVKGAHGVVKSTSPLSYITEYGSGPRIASPLHAKAMLINGDFVRGHVVSMAPERPFMRPAAEAGKPKIEAAVKEAIET